MLSIPSSKPLSGSRSDPLTLKLTHLAQSAHLLAPITPQISSHLLTRLRDLSYSKDIFSLKVKGGGFSLTDCCACCGAVWMPGWNCVVRSGSTSGYGARSGSGNNNNNNNGTKKRKKRREEKKEEQKGEERKEENDEKQRKRKRERQIQMREKREKYMTYECKSCGRVTRYEVPGTRVNRVVDKAHSPYPATGRAQEQTKQAGKIHTAGSCNTTTDALPKKQIQRSNLQAKQPQHQQHQERHQQLNKKRKKSKIATLQEQLLANNGRHVERTGDGGPVSRLNLMDLMKLD